MAWDKWKPDGTGQEKTEKTTVKKDGSSKEESLRTNEGSKTDHQHTWIDKDSEGNLKGGGATPGKKS